jgi:hypothetical protein
MRVAGLLHGRLFRKSVTGVFGIVTGGFGNVTGHFGDVTAGPSLAS